MIKKLHEIDFNKELQEDYKKADKFMLIIIFIHWLFVSTLSAYMYSTYLIGVLFGGLLFAVSLLTYKLFSGTLIMRIIVGLILLTFTIISIQQNLGRIEMHFHVFIALAFLTIYKDFIPVIVSALFIAVHHLIFTYLQLENVTVFDTPIMIYNYGCSFEIAFLHAFYVIFELVVLVIIIKKTKDAFNSNVTYKNELRHSNEEIENVKLNLENVSDTIQDLIFYKDLDLKFIGLNDACCKLFGKEREEIIGKTDFDFLPQEVAQKVYDMDKQVLTSKKSVFFEEDIPDSNGNIRNFATQKHVLRNKEGNVYGIVGSVKDITEQKKAEQEIKQLHKNTTDSIEYASLIQSALIPDKSLFKNYFNDYFAIWQPKDIVGGDIYLFEELRDRNEFLLMVIDCTGHGVPGAFVTMLVKAIERQIISKIENDRSIEVSPAWILSYFNRTMKKLLQQESEESLSNAGLDGGIVYFNKEKNLLKFAGAETPLFYIEDGELQTIKGNRHSIGYKKSDIEYEFKDHTIPLKEGMKFYLTTDGYFDQNGGGKGFPFGKKRFTTLIEKNHNTSFADQQEFLLYEIQKYQGDEQRNDDVTVIGFEILNDSNQFNKEIIIEYDGILTQGIIAHTAEIIEKKILNIGMMGKISTVAIELLQNMMHYGEGEGSFELINYYDYYGIKAKNIVLKEGKNKIEEILLEIKSLDEAEIKKRYRELRRSGENTHGKGGGIGLYEIAKLVKSIEYQFVEVDENTYTYEFTAQIASKKKEDKKID